MQILKYPAFFLLLVLLGCAQNAEQSSVEMAGEEIATPAEPAASEQKSEETINRKLIKEGSVSFETEDISTTREVIYAAVDKYKGYVSSDQSYNSTGRKSNTIVIRVPAVHFDSLLRAATKGVEKFDSKDITVKDVTAEFLDIEARLKTKKELENRYRALLKKANNIKEILEIEKQIGQLRSDIESIEGRLKYLQNRVSFSTLTMTFFTSVPHQTAFGKKFSEGFANGWNNLVWFFVILTNIWPFLIIGFGLIIGIRMYRKRKK